ncbi:MAG: carboxypeptidase-like regulatory domain-containing protein [Tannerella sp.]|jgi:hypothetical protein|nr:carboxypeptidase-like regulatory domain-containing protein [Tannerella sp.]
MNPPTDKSRKRHTITPINHSLSVIRYSLFAIHCLLCLLCLTAISASAQGNGALDRTVKITRNKGKVYELLKNVSDRTGFMFIYDSRIIDNDRKVTVKKGTYPLGDAIRLITGNDSLRLDVSGSYILLRAPEGTAGGIAEAADRIASASARAREEDANITIGGSLYDSRTGEPVIYATVYILNSSIGTVTNRDGEFQIVAADTLRRLKVRFSHVGYESREIDVSLLDGRRIDLALTPRTVSLQEVVVKAVDPEQTLMEMLGRRPLNYASAPVCLTAFYREGIEHKDVNIDLTESVLQIYKTGYGSDASGDQVKLIKKRRIMSRHKTDTIFPKMRSGIQSCLVLDIIKELPEFLDPGDNTQYRYSYKGKSIVDDRLADIVGFRQKDFIKDPLYAGELIIESESRALTEVRFEINPRYADKATHIFIDKKALGLKINLQQAKYIVSYKPSGDGRYYINHVRGDLWFKVRRDNTLFSSSLNFWFEMVTCRIDTVDVKPFPPNERISTSRIFAETEHDYDESFWKNFNTILPEEELLENILRNLEDER